MNDYSELKDYIENYWPSLLVRNTRENKQRLGLPNPYYVPSTKVVDRFMFTNMFYWDSFFMTQGFWGTDRQDKILGICENMFKLIDKLGYVPNSNSYAGLAHSQPPFLSTLVIQVYSKIKDDKEWLAGAYEKVVEEYKTCWIGTVQPHNRMVYEGLSRYYDPNMVHDMAEAESGWDYTNRFDERCLDFLPVDLNCFLYKYEKDLSTIANILGRRPEAEQWEKAAKQRKITLDKLMWNEEKGLFFDYDYKNQKQGEIISAAVFASLFSGLASEHQAKRIVENLSLLEFEHGLSTTGKEEVPTNGKQWTYPNGWAPLHDIAFEGLLRYGYRDEALRLAEKWVSTVNHVYKKSGVVYEKYNIINIDEAPERAIYPDQQGFGWTNAITYKFIRFLETHASINNQ